MRIVIMSDFFSEPLEYQENLLVKYYGKHGHAVTVLTSTFTSVFDYYADRYDPRLPEQTVTYGSAKIVRLPYRYNILNRLRAFRRLDDILARERPDLIFVHDIMPNLLDVLRYQRRVPHCRIILGYHADSSNSGRNWLSLRILHGVIRKWFLDRARPRLSRIFPIVPASAQFLHEIYGVPHAEMELLPLGADTDLGAEVVARGEGSALRTALGIPADHVVIFTGGKLTPGKRTELLIHALRQLAQPNLHLIVVGDVDAGKEQYKRVLAEAAQGLANVRFVGWQERRDIYRHMAACDLAVFPASQSILWQQAISMGLPLIVGDSGGQDVTYLNGHDNIVILRGQEISSEHLARAIRDLTADGTRLQRMRAGARQVCDELLDWNRLILRTTRFNEERAPAAAADSPQHVSVR